MVDITKLYKTDAFGQMILTCTQEELESIPLSDINIMMRYGFRDKEFRKLLLAKKAIQEKINKLKGGR